MTSAPDPLPSTFLVTTSRAEAASMGDLGAMFALRGDRYLPRGGVRHRTTPNFLEPATLVAACGIAASAAYWRGTGTQEEYERLASIPRCTRCLSQEGREFSMTDLPSTFFYDLKRSDYPFVLRLYDETTGELVWETTVTEPGTTKIPGRAETGARSTDDR